MSKTAVIVGSAGQDGTLLTELLIAKNYNVVGIKRGDLDITDDKAVGRLLSSVKPEEVYFLAAFHHSSEALPLPSSELEELSTKIHVEAPRCFLRLIHAHHPGVRFFYASTSHIYAPDEENVLTEESKRSPVSVYARTKLEGMRVCHEFRGEGVFAACGILFNHESALRPSRFVSKKIVEGAASIKQGKSSQLVLGSLQAVVDWGHAKDYVRAMWEILQLTSPGEFNVCSGRGHTVRDFVEKAFQVVGEDYKKFVVEDAAAIKRELPRRVGSFKKLHQQTGWSPSTTFAAMVEEMMDHELNHGTADKH